MSDLVDSIHDSTREEVYKALGVKRTHESIGVLTT